MQLDPRPVVASARWLRAVGGVLISAVLTLAFCAAERCRCASVRRTCGLGGSFRRVVVFARRRIRDQRRRCRDRDGHPRRHAGIQDHLYVVFRPRHARERYRDDTRHVCGRMERARGSGPRPRVGETGTLRLKRGIIYDSLTKGNLTAFCDHSAASRDACGA